MKKITLFLFVIFMVAVSSVSAQLPIDITSTPFVFANRTVGPFVFDGICDHPEESNAPNNFTAAKSDNGGFTYLFGWGPTYAVDGVDKGNTPYIRQMSNIVDLGGEVGKVLCFKGHLCEDDVFPYGIKPAAAPEGGIGWPHMALYMGSKLKGSDYNAKTKYKARFSMTWRVCFPAEEYSETTGAFGIAVRDFSNNEKAVFKTASADTEDEDVWCKQEADFEFMGDNQNVPLYLKLSFDKITSLKGALLIKELKITVNPEGKAVPLEQITLAMNPPTSSIKDGFISSATYLIEGDNIVVSNLANEKIALYNTLGATVAELNATQSTETITVKENGIFILKVGDKSFKIVK